MTRGHPMSNPTPEPAKTTRPGPVNPSKDGR